MFIVETREVIEIRMSSRNASAAAPCTPLISRRASTAADGGGLVGDCGTGDSCAVVPASRGRRCIRRRDGAPAHEDDASVRALLASDRTESRFFIPESNALGTNEKKELWPSISMGA